MKVESWQGINGKLVHDGQKAIVVDNDQALTDQKQLQAILDQDGQPIDEVRRAMIKKTVKRQLKTPPLKLRGWFNRHQDSQNAKKVEKLVSDKPTHQYKQIKNEMTFFGESFLEGFLGFYGLEVDNALATDPLPSQQIAEEQLNKFYQREPEETQAEQIQLRTSEDDGKEE